ncbi:autotransporter outer membrane beta-barrel domain-containing protein [Pantoea sp. RIT413]|uniref:autotransporter outer membrane beta-barrel domain-containing protein n=1 Tax=Pantoea sp. RIT413 TaxID=2202162 RepID=UPI000D34F2BC|nr:autotransporter outer membrane beta-barrel domain-containing protein [Pantoea sp. RIT 413]RAU29940.1 autotransporter outer membrane beta-barrel domain-containing protein [Pantoea sp. RIT 413]
MKPLKKKSLSLAITLVLTLGQTASAGINYTGDTIFTGPPPPAQGAGSWDGYGQAGEIYVGETRNGTLQVTNGAKIAANSLTTGNYGTTTVTGSGSVITVSSLSNYGSLVVSDGAQLEFFTSSLESGSNTLLTSGAQLTSNNLLAIHIRENASLVIHDRAIADLSRAIISGGAVQVSDNGAQLKVQNNLELTSGSAQNGQLQVADGGRAEIGGALTLSGSGGNLAIVDIARTSDGAADATVSAGSVLLDNSDTRLNVSGAGSLLTVAGSLVSSGVTALSAGGKIVTDSLTNRGGAILLADGRGTALAVTSALINDNILQVTDGAAVRAASLTNNARVNLSGEDTRLDVTGQLTSSDSLLVQNGAILAADVLLIQGGNTGLDSTLTLAGRGGTIETDAVALASGAYSRASVDFMHANTDLRFAPRITGDGDVNVSSGITTLLAQNDYRGDTRLSGGVLRAGADNVFSAASAYTLTTGGTLDLNGFSQRTGDIVNGGTLNLAGKTAGAVLTVDGNYTGSGGLIHFGTRLGADGSPTDRMVVTGDTAGDTFLRVSNLGGRGAETLNGITLVEVQGQSDGNFIQENRIVAGAYDYRLYRDGKAWKITSFDDLEHWLPIIDDSREEGAGEGGSGGGEGGEGGDNGAGGGTGTPGKGRLTLRPEGAAYAANLAAASTLFDTRMSDRQGTWYTDPQTGGARYTSLWLRTGGSHGRLSAGDGQLKTRSNSAVTQLGSDLRVTETTRLGVMAGYGTSRSRSASSLTGYRARGEVQGYGAGIYGSWQAAGTDERGLWADGTLQYGRFDNSVSGEGQAGESYKSAGLTASLEAGYVIPLGEGERTRVFLQPQARAAWSGVRADDHTEANGTRVHSSGQDNVRSSVGVKTFMKSHAAMDDHTGREFTSFVEANWIHNTKDYAAEMDGVRVSQQGSRNAGELRAGVEGKLGNGFGVSLAVGQQMGDKGWSDTAATLGVSYRF